MGFRGKLILLLVLVAVLPVATSGFLSALSSEREMAYRIRNFQEKSATLVAEAVDTFLLDATNALKLSSKLIPFDQFPTADLPDALRIPYRQFDFVNVVALLDESGTQLAEPAFETQPELGEATRNHESVTTEEVATFGTHIPLTAALGSEVAFGPVYVCERTRTARVAVAIAFPVQKGQARWVLAVELSLRKIADKVLPASPGKAGRAYVVDGEGKPVVHPDSSTLNARVPMMDNAVVSDGLATRRAFSRRYTAPDGQEMAAAFAPVPILGWGLVVEQPVAEAFAAVRRIRTFAILWVVLALAVAIFGGILFARGVSRPVRELAAGVSEVTEGKFDQQIPVRTRDEIGHLAGTFNRMASSLKESFETISEQKSEIERWNQELQARVEDRTRELKEAQDQILRSQKLAAIGELGAGVAHEINNPLTGIQGFAQIMLMEAGDDHRFRKHLDTIVEETDRIRSVVGDLLRFSHNPEGVNKLPIDLNATVTNALRMAERQLEEAGVEVELALANTPPRVNGDPYALQQVFVHLISNARNAMPDGGSLKLTTREIEGGAIRITVADTGRGIPEAHLTRLFDPFYTTKDDWRGKGMGLSVAHRIIDEHNGRISVESQVGQGTTFTLILPGLPVATHLA